MESELLEEARDREDNRVVIRRGVCVPRSVVVLEVELEHGRLDRAVVEAKRRSLHAGSVEVDLIPAHDEGERPFGKEEDRAPIDEALRHEVVVRLDVVAPEVAGNSAHACEGVAFDPRVGAFTLDLDRPDRNVDDLELRDRDEAVDRAGRHVVVARFVVRAAVRGDSELAADDRADTQAADARELVVDVVEARRAEPRSVGARAADSGAGVDRGRARVVEALVTARDVRLVLDLAVAILGRDVAEEAGSDLAKRRRNYGAVDERAVGEIVDRRVVDQVELAERVEDDAAASSSDIDSSSTTTATAAKKEIIRGEPSIVLLDPCA